MPFTPGPWSADFETEDGEDVTISAPDPSGVHVASVTTCWPCADDQDGEQQEEGEANARLIAAVPDLLAACKVALAEGSGAVFQLSHPTLDVLRAAIYKAEGR